ncbi:hypothetical protein AB9P05_18165 [Roseivirga sp. BDSF3-8]|uniref:hypothetical protein n=1 Tax=Roseivirga sp. BDSF3-8 TaxID=3241598 RepID=UPI0035320663
MSKKKFSLDTLEINSFVTLETRKKVVGGGETCECCEPAETYPDPRCPASITTGCANYCAV